MTNCFSIDGIACIHLSFFNFGCFLGHTDDYAEMITNLETRYPKTNIVSVGFSLGGNIVTKYMGEHATRLPNNIIGGISICQGYNAVA